MEKEEEGKKKKNELLEWLFVICNVNLEKRRLQNEKKEAPLIYRKKKKLSLASFFFFLKKKNLQMPCWREIWRKSKLSQIWKRLIKTKIIFLCTIDFA